MRVDGTGQKWDRTLPNATLIDPNCAKISRALHWLPCTLQLTLVNENVGTCLTQATREIPVRRLARTMKFIRVYRQDADLSPPTEPERLSAASADRDRSRRNAIEGNRSQSIRNDLSADQQRSPSSRVVTASSQQVVTCRHLLRTLTAETETLHLLASPCIYGLS